MLVTAENLFDPKSGDVIFECRNSDDENSRFLYASTSVLSENSLYYSTSLSTINAWLTCAVFNSLFAEGNSEATSQRSSPTNRKRIVVDDPFDLFHTIIYYLYTKRILLTNNLGVVPSVPLKRNSPRQCSTEAIYVLADRLLLGNLKSKVFHFLKRTCAKENIRTRIFGELASQYTEIRQMFIRWFLDEDLMDDPEEFWFTLRDVAMSI